MTNKIKHHETIFLITHINENLLTAGEIENVKFYSFNTESNLKVGDIVSLENYPTDMQVVEVFESSFKYYNTNTGTFSNEFTSANDREIATLVIKENTIGVIYGTLVKEM